MATPQQTPTPGHGENEAPVGSEAKELPSTDQKDEEGSKPTRKFPNQDKGGNKKIAGSQVKEHVEDTSRELMNYISQLETRIKRLETGGHDEEIRTTRSRSGITQFFLAADKPPPEDEEDNRWKNHGTFTSEVDENTLIRAMYRRIGPKSDHGENAPSPKDIDVLELRITSKSVVDFLNRQLEFDFGDDGVIHFVKPFRTLIRNFSFIKKECDRLVGENVTDKSGDSGSQAGAVATADAGTSPEGGPKEPPHSEPSMIIDSKNPAHDFYHLAHFVETYLGASLALYNDYAGDFLTKVAFDNLWMLFDIGDIVYCPLKKGGQRIKQAISDPSYTTVAGLRPQAYKVTASIGGTLTERSISYSKVTDEQSSSGSKNNHIALYVFCLHLGFESGKIVILNDAFRFPPFDGEVDITSLEAYPIRYRRPSGIGGDDLVARGREFVDLMLVRHKRYDGLTASEKPEEINSDVVIDHAKALPLSLHQAPPHPTYTTVTNTWFYREHGAVREVRKRRCKHEECSEHCISDYYIGYQQDRYYDMQSRFNTKLEDENLGIRTERDIIRCKEFLDKENLLCLFEGIINGYSLRNRKWVKLDINFLQPVSYEDSWNELVLPEGHRKMVQAMVETLAVDSHLKTGIHDVEHQQLRPTIDKVGFDAVKHKGQGCVILLHGAPGVGKTSTAECVAAYTRRPLLPLTAGDIGYDPENVENRLTGHFDLAQRWGCVMLLDEADVFLAKRAKEDMQRNALVSVFLRVLEYYKGILILTTNRVGAFDEAFHSRIHLSLYYPTLDREKMIEIFKTHFQRIKKHNIERVQKGDTPIQSEKKLIQKYWRLNYKVLKWNGRQIRNAFQTALALAEYDARDSGDPPVITAKHFETIAHASADFARYVTVVQGAEADQIAMRDKSRLDRNPQVSSELKKLRSRSSSGSSGSEESSSGSSSGDDSDDFDDKKRRKKSKKKGKTREDRNDKKERKGNKGNKGSASGKGGGRRSKDPSSDEDD